MKRLEPIELIKATLFVLALNAAVVAVIFGPIYIAYLLR